MNVYLDASALVKRYVSETGSKDVDLLIDTSDSVVTAIISRAEVAASLAKAVRVGALTRRMAFVALDSFHGEWDDFGRLPLTEAVVARADTLAWDLDLRGYDAVHLAAAVVWQETLGHPVVMATFDHQLWSAAEKVGLLFWPAGLI